jgi:tetratricopeptide (TPR) repeat protein
MIKAKEKLVRQAVILELKRLSLSLDTELETTAHLSAEDVEDNLREIGIDPNQPLPTKLRQLIFAEASEQQAVYAIGGVGEWVEGERLDQRRKKTSHVCVSNAPLQNECSDEVRSLILEIRFLARQHRYDEALELAIEATQLDPNYWRAWITRGTLLVIADKIDEGDRIFAQVSKDFHDNSKARAAGLHGCAWALETRYGLDPPPDVLLEVSRLYKEALRLDGLRANTRASSLIYHFKSDETDKDWKLLEASGVYEGFLTELAFELNCRGERLNGCGARAYKILLALFMWLRHFMSSDGPRPAAGYSY